MTWFDEYRKLVKDEREYYKEYIYEDEQKAIALDYDRLIESLNYVASSPKALNEQINRHLNLAEEVALSFENEAFSISMYLFEMKLIDAESMKMIMKIKELFNKIDLDVNNDWSLEYMIHDEKWICIRSIANDILSKLEISGNEKCE